MITSVRKVINAFRNLIKGFRRVGGWAGSPELLFREVKICLGRWDAGPHFLKCNLIKTYATIRAEQLY